MAIIKVPVHSGNGPVQEGCAHSAVMTEVHVLLSRGFTDTLANLNLDVLS